MISQAAEPRYISLDIFESAIHGEMSLDCFELQEDGESTDDDVPQMLEKSSHDLKDVGLCGEKPHEPSKLGENRWTSRTF